MVIADEETPFAFIGDVPVIVDVVLLADPAIKLTVPPERLMGVLIERVFNSAFVDFRVQVDCPDAFVELQVPYVLVVPVSVAEKVGTVPITGLLFTSSRVIETADELLPFATTGPLPVIDDVTVLGLPATNETIPSDFDMGEVM